jgi:hypothetical protein
MNPKTLCVDFDGVIHSYRSGWVGPRNIPDDPVPGAMDFLEGALKRFDVSIHSSRNRYPLARRAMKKWLVQHLTDHFTNKYPDLALTPNPFNKEDELIPASMAKDVVRALRFPAKKPPAHAILDDRAIPFTGTFPDLSVLETFTPWNRAPSKPIASYTANPSGAEMILEERRRQITEEGYDKDHDDNTDHEDGELAWAAICYAAPDLIYRIESAKYDELFLRDPWPKAWARQHDKRDQHDRIRCLQIAGALIAAEIDRLTRAKNQGDGEERRRQITEEGYDKDHDDNTDHEVSHHNQ